MVFGATTLLRHTAFCVNLVEHMPITKSAKKALRGSDKKRVFNLRRKEVMKDASKDIRKMATSGDAKKAAAELSKAFQAIDKAAKTGLIKKGAADRKKSRLAKLVAKAK